MLINEKEDINDNEICFSKSQGTDVDQYILYHNIDHLLDCVQWLCLIN
jgi:hypothetical protein